MKKNIKIPLFQMVYLVILLLLILLRILCNNLDLYINLANYISMVVAIASVFYSSTAKIHEKRRRNISKAVFILIMIAFSGAGFIILVSNVDVPSIINDVFTLIALMFCLCNKVFEFIIVKIASLKNK